MAMVINEADPCGSAATLRQAYYTLVAGGAPLTISFKAGANGVERLTTFNKGSPEALLKVIRSFEAKCAVANGDRPTRFALRAGGGTNGPGPGKGPFDGSIF
jgi:hypothetical protein